MNSLIISFTNQSWTVIFPEGTCFAPNEYDLIKKSNKAADANGLKPLVNHLTPRYRGSFLALAKLRSNLDAIYDVTCVYSGSVNEKKERTPAPELIGKKHFNFSKSSNTIKYAMTKYSTQCRFSPRQKSRNVYSREAYSY